MKKHIIYILICFWVAKIGAQPKNAELGDIQVAAPEVAALGKYIDIPVSSFTGVAPVNIPIHQLQEGPLSVPVSLSYHGSGIRAAETASWVGLGWNLNASGVISRTILGIPDDNTNGFLKSTHNYNNSNVLEQVSAGLIDGEPDLFSFSLPGGISGKFIINKKIGDVYDIVQFPRTDIRIEVDSDDLEEFTVITTDGTRYLFGQSGNETYDGFTTVKQGSPIQRNSPKRQHTEWYLRKVESYDGNYHIDFNYIAKEFGIVSPASQSYSKVYADYNYSSELTPQIFTDANYGDGGVLESLGQFQILGPNNGRTQLSLYGNFQGHETKQILSITTSTTIVEFNEGNEIRQDVNSYPYTTSIITDEVQFHDCKYLDEIKIRPINGNTFCKSFNFNYDYFKSVDNPLYTFDLRLKLNQVQEISCTVGGDVVPPYKFDYYKEDGKSYYSVPWRLTKATDAWGYYNGATSNDDEKFNFPPTTLGVSLNNVNLATESKGNANRSTNEDAMRLGALRKITFPEKGYTEFDLKANTVKKEQYDTTIVDRPKADILPLGLPVKISSCSENNANGDCCPDATNSVLYNFTEDYIEKAVFKIYLEDIRATTNQNSLLCEDDQVGVWDGHIDISLTPEGQTGALYPTIELNDNQSDSFLVNLKDHYPNIAPGNYTVSILSAFCRGTLRFMEEEYTDVSDNEEVGGLRIKEKKTYDQNDNLLRSMAYDYENPEDVGFSSGVLYKKPSFGHVVASADQTVIGTGGNVSVYYAKLTFSSSQTVPLTDIQGYHIGYENVKATETNGAFTTYLHKTRSLDEEITTVQPYPLAPLPYFYDNGVLLESNQGTSSDTIATNKTIGDQVIQGIVPRNAVRVDLASGQQGSLTLLVPNRFTYQQTGFYRQYQQFSTLDGVTTQTIYDYDEPINRFLSPRSITTTNSDGKTYKREFTYVHHLEPSSSIYEEMFERNIINNPITVREYVINNGVETQIKGSRTEYSMFDANGNNVGSTLTNANPYPHTYEQYEMTWDANGNPQKNGDGWRVVGTVNSYHNNGKPAEFTRDGWKKETYTWHPVNNLLATRTFEGFTWQYNYHPSTRLVSEIINIDGQDTDYAYDGLMRLDSIIERDRNVITDFTYRYAGQDASHPQNHVKTKTTLVPSIGSNYTEKTTYQYFDDIGRMVQTVNQAYSPNQKDVVEAIVYDQFGRTTHSYEAFEATTTNGAFASTIPTNTPFSFLDYEDSPLNRVISETPPDWHISHREYGNNTIPITIPGTSITYAVGELSVEKIIDPDGNGTKTGDQTIVYKDKKGQTILSVQQNSSGSEKAETYYVYDDKDRMVMVIPPDATANNTGLIYEYTYDERNRVATSKIPDSEFMEYTYNTRDLQIGMRNGNLRTDGKWMVTEYDDYGRPTKTGLNTSATTVNELWSQVFYDGFDGTSTLPDAIHTGKVRKRVAYILNGNSVNTMDKIETSFLYDAFGRVEQQDMNTHLGGTDSYTYSHDYADNMLTENRTLAISGQASQSINYRYTYDHRGRLEETFHQVTGIAEQRLCKFDYTHKDEILNKHLGGNGTNYLQSLNYTYNAQSWLMSINQELSNSNDLFHLKLAYDNPENLIGAVGRFDGNIAQANWQVKGQQERTYGFQYDYLDRLTSSVHGTYQNAARNSLNIDNNYNTTYSYDKRGNIQTLTRDGLYNNNATWERQQIDDLDYDYYPNSNRISTITDAVSGGADCPPNLTINTPTTQSGMYAASNQIIGSNSVGNSLNVNFQAGNRIELDPGFIMEPTSTARFTAELGDCPTTDSDFGGFVQNGTGLYEYDKNGNLTIDPHKQINIEYNYLNLPYKVTFTGDNSQKVIEWLYDASGVKLQKKVSDGGNSILTQDYISGVEYNNNTLEAVYTSEGRVYYENSSGRYEYTIQDHLGNTRVTFADLNSNGVIEVANNEILQENHYYPFGLAMKGDFTSNIDKQNKYQFGGKEFNDDFGLNFNDFGARWYDPAIARWNSVDPMANSFASWSPYNYTYNNPINTVDPDGRAPWRIIVSAIKVGRKVYKYWKKAKKAGKKFTQDDMKRIGLDEIAGYADDFSTIFGSHSNWWDRGEAIIDVLVGTDFNKGKGQLLGKIADRINDSHKNVEGAILGALKEKADKIRDKLPNQIERDKRTFAVGAVEDSKGDVKLWATTSYDRFTPSQKREIKITGARPYGRNESIHTHTKVENGTLRYHAEHVMLQTADMMKSTIKGVGVSKPVCGTCQGILNSRGIKYKGGK